MYLNVFLNYSKFMMNVELPCRNVIIKLGRTNTQGLKVTEEKVLSLQCK